VATAATFIIPPSLSLFMADVTASFAAELAFWRQALDRYTPEQLADGASDDDWSVGQLYAHLTGSATYFHLPMARKALAESEAGGELSDRGRAALSGQELPPVKVPPSPTYTPRQPVNAEFIRTQLDGVEIAFAATAEQIAANADAPGTASHPSMGHLTAAEWLALVPVHFKGHRRQLARLDARLGLS
jgi:hypothetical protein